MYNYAIRNAANAGPHKVHSQNPAPSLTFRTVYACLYSYSKFKIQFLRKATISESQKGEFHIRFVKHLASISIHQPEICNVRTLNVTPHISNLYA